MAVYATKADMLNRYSEEELIQLTDREEPYTNAIVDGVLDTALADAGHEIDGYIGARYTLPLNPVPALLVPIACALTRAYLHVDAMPEEVSEKRDDALRKLKDISKGTMALPNPTSEPTPNESGAAVLSGPEREYTRDKLEGF
ncbi:MAG: gp436 family protein [Magnetovibrionaceae bacterium]